MALEFGVSLVFVPRADRTVHMTSQNFGGTVAFCLDDIPPCRRNGTTAEESNWGNFPRGAAKALLDSGHRCGHCCWVSLSPQFLLLCIYDAALLEFFHRQTRHP